MKKPVQKKPHVPIAVVAGKSYPQLWKEFKALIDRYERERNEAYSAWEKTIGQEFETQLAVYRKTMDTLRYGRSTE